MEKTIIFFEIMSGILVFRRISDDIRTNFLLEEHQLTKIVAVFFSLNVCLIFISSRSLSLFTVFWALIVVASAILPSTIRIYRQNDMKKQIPFIVNSLILNIRTGSALRSAILTVAEQMGGYSGLKLRLLHEHLVVKATMAQVDPTLYELQAVLKECDSEPHLNSQRLMGFRHKLTVQEGFHKTKRQALQQIRAQSVILSLIYVVLLGFVIQRFGFKENGRLIAGSVFLFSLGVFVTFRQGAKMKWTI